MGWLCSAESPRFSDLFTFGNSTGSSHFVFILSNLTCICCAKLGRRVASPGIRWMPDLGIGTPIAHALCTKCCHLAAQSLGMDAIMLRELLLSSALKGLSLQERSCLGSSLHAQSISFVLNCIRQHLPTTIRDSPVPKPCCCFRPIVGATSASTFVVESSAGKFSFRDHAGLHLTGQDESMDPGNRLIQISRECSSLNFSRVQVFDDI
ncbi:hypothetical protein MUK42_05024 [Musa troglodytarum]|uniref:Uncharacterized protein n=1 Tax=Musa troglodytarum TaxID=320322 RepID=A0A9E7ER72_9LILI|nr:hypothetical protein MUK42_05024 [Musa troglodytarum]